MKFLFIVILMMLATFAFTLDYTVELVDSYGDGWNGGLLDVLVNGVVILDDITVASGAGPEISSFTVAGGDEITTVYTAGNWSNENEYQIKDEAGIVVAESGQGGVTPGNVSYTVPQAGAPEDPSNPSPTDGAIDIALSGSLTWEWGANTDTYDLWIGPAGAMTEVVTGGAAGSEGTTGSYTYSGLANATNYEWQIIMHNTSRLDADGPVWSFTTTLGDDAVQVGAGSVTNQHLPIEPYYGYTYSQTIYLGSSFTGIASDKRIDKIWYNYSGNFVGANNDDWVIYMGTTTDTNLDGGWYDYANLTQVFDGDVNLELVSGTGWLEITLDVPFIFDPTTTNLVVAVDENSPSYSSGSDEFLCDQDVRANVSRYYYSDSTNLDPAAPSQAGTVSSYYPNMRFEFGDIPAGALITVSPNPHDFGTVIFQTSSTQVFTIQNIGSGTGDITSVTITGTNAGEFAIQNLASTPFSLESSASENFDVVYTPTIEGAVTANLEVVDNVTRQTHIIPLSGEGFDPVVSTFPYEEDFEDGGALPIGWTQDVADDFDWIIYAGGTPSSATGPTTDHNPGTSAGYYLFTESSGNNGNTANVISPPLNISSLTNPYLGFWYHMYGAAMGTLNVDYSTDGGANWANLWTLTGDQGDLWKQAIVELPAGTNLLRFSGTTGTSYTSDMAFDDVSVFDLDYPIFSVSPESKDFGMVNAGYVSEEETFTITNVGAGVLSITNVVLGGTDASQFVLNDPNRYPQNLNSGLSLSFTAQFTPNSTGAKTATITVTDDITREEHVINLFGTGYGLYAPSNLVATPGDGTVALSWDAPIMGEHRHDDGSVEQNMWVGAPSTTDQMMAVKHIAQITGTLDEISVYTYTGNGTDSFESIKIVGDNAGTPDLTNVLATFTGAAIQNIPTTHTWINLTPASTISLNSGDVFYIVAQWPAGNNNGPYIATDTNNSGYSYWTSDAGATAWNSWTGEFFMRAYMSPTSRNYGDLATVGNPVIGNATISTVLENQNNLRRNSSIQAQSLQRINGDRETFASYTVKRGTETGVYTELATGIATTTYDDGTVTNDTEYFYVVSAVYAEGESGNSNEATAIPSGNPPSEVAYTAPDSAAVNQLVLTTFSWEENVTASGYKLKYGVASGTYDTTIDCGNVTTYTLTTALAYNTEYFWQVVPYNDNGDATVTTEWNFTTFDGVATNPSPADDATAVANNAVLDWNDVNGALSYLITIGTTSGGSDVANAIPCANSEYTHSTTWDYEQEYFWTVTTVDAAGRTTVVSRETNSRNVTGTEWSFTVSSNPNYGGNNGYFFANSTSDASGSASQPVYDWVDISTTGTSILGDFGDDSTSGPYEIGFTFSYYGVDYTQMKICSNGWIALGNAETSTSYSNTTIPTAGTPNNILAWFWDDLNPTSTASPNRDVLIGNDDFGNRVITFFEYPEYGATSVEGCITAQVIIYSNGNVKYQYHTIGSTLDVTSATVGIENADGSLGIEYRYNTTTFGPLEDNSSRTPLAVAFGPDETKLDEIPGGALDTPVVTITEDAGVVTLSWVAIANANSYKVLSCDTPDGTFTQVAHVADLTWNDNTPGEKKFYKVIASSAVVVSRSSDKIRSENFRIISVDK
jgi:hypothetical protein